MKVLDKAARDQWVIWITRNLLREVSSEELVAAMLQKGFESEQARELVCSVERNPILQGARPLGWRVNNLEALLDIKRSLASQTPANSQVERRAGLSREEFHSQYYVRNKPVIVTDLVSRWPAFHLWSPAYFKEKYGDVFVDVQSGRKTEPVYEVFLKGHTKRIRLSEYIELLNHGGETNEYYLTANDRFLENEAVQSILDDFWPFPEFFKQDDRTGRQFLWIGPRGAVSPLHRDRLNVFMTQIYGRKRIKLISSDALHLVYNFESFFSEVDAENPDTERHPLFAQAEIVDVTLEPGEALLIPVGWWHHVRSLDVSINVSLTNFVFPNDFERFYSRSRPRRN